MPHRTLCVVLLTLVGATRLLAAPPEDSLSPTDVEFFEKEIRPIFAMHCYECHGAEEQEAGLRLDLKATAFKGGDSGPAIVPGKVDEGELLSAISYDPLGYQMPPDGKLSEEVIAKLKRWVAMGAPWPDDPDASDAADLKTFDLAARAQHWSFQPLSTAPSPSPVDPDWVRNEIDPFILQKLSEAGLEPTPAADRRVWLRRTYLDVIGLPPTPAQVDSFLSDTRPGAEERVIDELLASPHFGERWGRHWLDLVRYAESRGHEFDFDVANPWHYRDYVVRSLNADVSYSQFLTEHVAGDLLSDTPTPSGLTRRIDPASKRNESILGTGFWFLGEWVHSPVDIRQEEAERFDNMIDVYSKTFLGLTVACARCHDHKFDPIRQRDFYAIQGYLQSSVYRQARFETAHHNADIAKQVDALRAATSRKLARTYADLVEPTLNDLDRYLLAARETLDRGLELTQSRPEIVIADFESGSYDGWTVEGDAFGGRPQTQQTIASYQGDVGAQGEYFINSHQRRDGGRGDDHTGSLTSAPFVIERHGIRFLVGGGSHRNRTCVQLIVDQRAVREATGRNDNRMHPVVWDVAEFAGKEARLRIVDEVRGGWGNIGADDFVQTDEIPGGASTAGTSNLSPQDRQRIVSIARAHAVHVDTLEHWVLHLLNLQHDDAGNDPFVGWAEKEFSTTPVAVRTNAPRLDEILSDSDYDVIADFRDEQAFRVEGPAFGTVPRSTGDLQLGLDASNLLNHFVTGAGAYRDRFWDPLRPADGTIGEPGGMSKWNRAGRTLRTRTFEVTNGKLYALLAGGCETYASVDSHVLIRGPLHGKLLRHHEASDEWRWVSLDLSRYGEHRAHLEFVLNDSPFAIAAVVQGTRRPPVPVDYTTTPPQMPVARHKEAAALRARTAMEQVLRHLANPDDDAPTDNYQIDHWPSLANWMLEHPELVGFDDDARAALAKQAETYLETIDALRHQARFVSAVAPAMADASGEDEYIFIRGNWKKRGETAPRAFLEVFRQDAEGNGAKDGADVREGSGRLHLAEQMIDPDQTPIVPRVIVNRIWHHYFGRGLVPTPDDFGHLGQTPSHPELLDWLANELVRSGWSQKHIHRLILQSSTYRMSSAAHDSRAEEIDPDNVLLHRMNVKRMEGEILRDALLSVAHQLNPTMSGKSVPIHLTPFLEGRGRPSESGPVDGYGRRSLYLSIRRNFLNPMFVAYDFPTPHSTMGRRNVSNVPAQALVLMNNPLVMQQCERWAERICASKATQSPAERIQVLFSEAFARPAEPQEVAASLAFLDSQAATYDCDPEDQRVWTDLCHALVNMKEFVFVP